MPPPRQGFEEPCRTAGCHAQLRLRASHPTPPELAIGRPTCHTSRHPAQHAHQQEQPASAAAGPPGYCRQPAGPPATVRRLQQHQRARAGQATAAARQAARQAQLVRRRWGMDGKGVGLRIKMNEGVARRDVSLPGGRGTAQSNKVCKQGPEASHRRAGTNDMNGSGGRRAGAQGIHAAPAMIHGTDGSQDSNRPHTAVHSRRRAGQPDIGLGQWRSRGSAHGPHDGLGNRALPEVVVAVGDSCSAAAAGPLDV